MGAKCAPSIANLYLSIIEMSYRNINKFDLYNRFIDDCIIICKSDIDINSFCEHFDYLKLNVVCDKNVNFLDLNISINQLYR